MTLTIRWRPIKREGRHFLGGTQASLAVLQEIFGRSILAEHIPMLRAMATAAGDSFYSEVADAIERAGEIEFWGEP